ncbi:hypothetical protein DPMN_088700 [Dreissena polymorpha]|uniref:Uncharacterized protein n=1 Tax=Dreissena polymorpha TaxID=45954 RepID=A0A9D4KVD5_DREPO|nr:hypothetical protein DPMN_088700 [Dreissena polymorpha]
MFLMALQLASLKPSLHTCAVWSGAALSAINHARFCGLIRYLLTRLRDVQAGP